jgi:hypothetical protein
MSDTAFAMAIIATGSRLIAAFGGSYRLFISNQDIFKQEDWMKTRDRILRNCQ